MKKPPELRQASPAPGNRLPPLPQPPCGCDRDPVDALKKMFVDFFQGRHFAAGESPARRPVFLRLHGVAYGVLRVRPDLPPDLRIGVFGQKDEYAAWVRFSSDLQDGATDVKGTVGVGVKLFGVDGPKMLPHAETVTTHDFVFQNHDVFFVDTAKDMCEFTCLALNGRFNDYVNAHPTTGAILKEMEKIVPSALDQDYWSVLPSRFGNDRYVKYKLVPENPAGTGTTPDYSDPFYLRADLQARLRTNDVRFRMMVQFQTNDAEMPLDRATVRWSEAASAPIHVATLVMPKQDADTRGQSAYGENLSFNPWRALAEHQPVGSIADARKVVYAASAEARRNTNGVPVAEPDEPRPAELRPGEPYPVAKDTVIVRASIHPAIGVARLGNSELTFDAPEVTEPKPAAPGAYRDETGALKRQAARFRIYGRNAAGEVVRELTADDATIRWTVHVANNKAAWYRWILAQDIPEAAGIKAPRRNAKVTGASRKQLSIDGGPISIAGKSEAGPSYRFEGDFMGTKVYLGEVRTDEEGHLLFVGGRGTSGSPSGTPIYDPKDDDSFGNAEGWYDDICDGPVTAEVAIEGRAIPVEPAWVLTAPPNYAPDTIGLRTLYDLLFDLFVQAGWLKAPQKVSFNEDVYPILRRLQALQWVNKGFAAQFGAGAPNDFANEEYVAKLAFKPASGQFDTYGELRLQVLNAFRDPATGDPSRLPWPWIYGDAMDRRPSARENIALSGTQYAALQRWAMGDFDGDWPSAKAPPQELKDVPLRERPAMLDRAALHFCLADGFHPGCEVTWPIRHLTLFSSPFRIRHRAPEEPERDHGDTLTGATAVALDGPTYAQGPGGLTRWMAVPWQIDTAFCRSGYVPTYDPYLPTFWPARVPNDVLKEADYAIAMDASKPRAERIAAFSRREKWVRFLGKSSVAAQGMAMVAKFGAMGVVEARPGVEGDPELPSTMSVESTTLEEAPKLVEAVVLAEIAAPPGATAAVAALRERIVREGGWASQEQAEEFSRIAGTGKLD